MEDPLTYDEDQQDHMQGSFSEISEVTWPTFSKPSFSKIQRPKKVTNSNKHRKPTTQDNTNIKLPQIQKMKVSEVVTEPVTNKPRTRAKISPFDRIKNFRPKRQRYQRPQRKNKTTTSPSTIDGNTIQSTSENTPKIVTTTNAPPPTTKKTMSKKAQRFDFMSRFRNRKKHSIRQEPSKLKNQVQKSDNLIKDIEKEYSVIQDIQPDPIQVQHIRSPIESVFLQDPIIEPLLQEENRQTSEESEEIISNSDKTETSNKIIKVPIPKINIKELQEQAKSFEDSIKMPEIAIMSDVVDVPKVASYEVSPLHMPLMLGFEFEEKDFTPKWEVVREVEPLNFNQQAESEHNTEIEAEENSGYKKSPSYTNVEVISGREFNE